MRTSDFATGWRLAQPGGEAQFAVLQEQQSSARLMSPWCTGCCRHAAKAAAGRRGTRLAVQTPDERTAERLGIEPGVGVVVTQVARQSAAARAGIRPGALILQVNRQPVNSAEAFYQAIEASPDNRAVLLVRAGNAQQYVVLRW
ncbi:MAG: PDZ domain-containing protein [Gammaproteobacteria bacterium]|nr:PDZ domain-containing protein [Gammaproteobacteria bacterium]